MKREIQIAILAIFTLIASIWGFNFISGKSLFSGDKTYYAIFDNVKDVNTATAVLVNGYQVGTVINILPESEDISKMKVGFQIKKEIKVPKNAIVELRSSSPLGGREMELVFEKMCDGTNCAENGTVLQGRTVGVLGSLISPEDIEPHVESLSSALNKALTDIGNPESDEALDKTIRNFSVTMENLAATSKNLEALTSKSARNLDITLANMAVLTESLVNSNETLASILENVDKTTQDLSESSLSETISKTNTTVDQAGSSLKSLETTMDEATATIKELNSLLVKVGSEDGSLGAMINSKEFYDQINETNKNLNLLLQDIRLNPRRYFRLFGKKSPEYSFPVEDPGFKGLKENDK